MGAMIAFDLSGPVNKTEFFFGAAMMQQGDYRIMGACAAAICTPPLGMGLATIVRKKLWSQEEQEAGIVAASVVAMMGHVGDHALHGGPIVLPVIDHRLAYVLAISMGTLVTAISINVVKTWSCSRAKDRERAA
jgi:fructose-specific phosphotransferase system IIC component